MSKSKDLIKNEAIDAIGHKRHAGIAVTVGGGKTNIALCHANMHYSDRLRILVAAPMLSIHESWKEEAVKHGLQHLLPHIEYTTYLSLPDKDLDYDILYLDECHSLTFNHDEWLEKFEGKIIGLTGTPPVHKNSEKGLMVAKYCPIVYEYLMDEAVKDGVLNDYEVIIHRLPLDQRRNMKVKRKDGGFFISSEYDVYKYWTQRVDNATTPAFKQKAAIMRMKSMQTFPSKEVLATTILDLVTNKCMLFANTKEQADKLCTHSYHSGNKKSEENMEAFKQGKITKMSSVLQLKEGITVQGLKESIIMHAYGNERKTKQRMGRNMRLDVDDLATIHILCYKDTVDEKWVRDSIADLDPKKITYKDY
jgi:superfamily II DNA or RNA helicase